MVSAIPRSTALCPPDCNVCALRVLVGPSLDRLHRLILQIAPTDGVVLVQGPTGSGKELVARAIHRLGACREGPFIPVNCAGLPTSLFFGEIFGHEPGAFTSADRRRPGLVEQANGGTLFLDEIGDLGLEAQGTLLRLVVAQADYARLGGERTRPVRCRIVCATNRDLEARVRDGRFREEVLHRLRVHVVTLASLNDRRGDIAALVEHFLARLRLQRPALHMAPETLERLVATDWSGNVRQLENALEAAAAVTAGRIAPEDLPAWLPARIATATKRRRDTRRILVSRRTREPDVSAAQLATELGVSERYVRKLLGGM